MWAATSTTGLSMTLLRKPVASCCCLHVLACMLMAFALVVISTAGYEAILSCKLCACSCCLHVLVCMHGDYVGSDWHKCLINDLLCGTLASGCCMQCCDVFARILSVAANTGVLYSHA